MKPFSRITTYKVRHWLLLLLIPVIYLQWKTLGLVRTMIASNSNGANRVRNANSGNIWDNSSSLMKGDFDQFVLEYIRLKHFIQYDPNAPISYTGSTEEWRNHMERKWTQRMPKLVAKHFKFKKNGFFVECGALDGAYLSNTLLLERLLGWTGILVEPDPVFLPALKRRNRRVWVSNACLSTLPHSMKMVITGHNDGESYAEIQTNVTDADNRTTSNVMLKRMFQAQCFPLSVLMAVINRTEIDYLSLDVGRAELQILKTIPFNRISIKLISVNVRPRTKKAIREFLEPIGYKRIKEVVIPVDYIHDDLYVFRGKK